MVNYEKKTFLLKNQSIFEILILNFFEEKLMPDIHDTSKFHGETQMTNEVITFYLCTVFLEHPLFLRSENTN